MAASQTREPIVMSWSGGKDSAMALYELMSGGKYDVRYLLTTVTEEYDRVSMHGVRSDLLREQAYQIGVPLDIAYIHAKSSNEEYGKVMKSKLAKYKDEGIMKVAFGDIFLADVRQYRERTMDKVGMSCVFPLWGRDTMSLARDFIKNGFESIICSLDPRVMPKDLAGSLFSDALTSFPSGVDPCGENGEFHTFVFRGPIFKNPIGFIKGETVTRDSYIFTDLISEGEHQSQFPQNG